MKKIYLSLSILVLSLGALNVSAVTVPVSLFTDSFESGNFSNWTTSDKGADKWAVLPGILIKAQDGKKDAEVSRILKKPTTDWKLTKNISTVGYDNLTLSFYYLIPKLNHLEANDHFVAEYFDGSAWQKVGDITNTDTGKSWKLVSHTLPVGANDNAKFAFRLRAQFSPAVKGLDALDTVIIDNVKLAGQKMLPPVLVGSISTSLSPNSPATSRVAISSIVDETTPDVILGIFRLGVTNQNAELDSLKIKINNDKGVDPNTLFSNVRLVDNGNTYNASSFSADGTASFNELNIPLPKDIKKDFSVRVDVKGGPTEFSAYTTLLASSIIAFDVNYNPVATTSAINVVSNNITFTLPIAQYSITVTQGANGTISPDTTSIVSGGSQTFTIVSSTGYQIANLIVDGATTTASSTYAFANVVAPHTFSAVFSSIPPVITTPQFILSWGDSHGGQDLGDGHFSSPRALAVNKNGEVYVTETTSQGNYETTNTRVQKFTNDGAFLLKWGTNGNGEGQFGGEKGIAIDSKGNVYVADMLNRRIQKFDANGNFIAIWGGFDFTRGVAVDKNDNVYITEGDSIQKFDENGNFLLSFGSYEWDSYVGANGLFNMPTDLTVDSQGNIYVLDGYNGPTKWGLQKFDSSGKYLLSWGLGGSADGQITGALGITVDGSDNIYVADSGNGRIQKFDTNGNFLQKWSSFGNGGGQFNSPQDIAIDNNGNIFVLDWGVHKFK